MSHERNNFRQVGNEHLRNYRAVIHGSYKEATWPLVQSIRDYFETQGITVVAPRGNVIGYEAGFALLEGDNGQDRRITELAYLHHVQDLRGPTGFSYFVSLDGRIGRSALAEHSMATAWGVSTYFNKEPDDMPVFIPQRSVIEPDQLVEYIRRNDSLPPRESPTIDQPVAQLHRGLSKSTQAIGAIMEHTPQSGVPEIFLVRTHQWRDRWSIVGQRLTPGQTFIQTLLDGIKEETDNTSWGEPRFLTAFDQIPDSGYHRPRVLTFTDYVVPMGNRRFRLNSEAQEGLWIPPSVALRELDIEPNARKSIELYLRTPGVRQT